MSTEHTSTTPPPVSRQTSSTIAPLEPQPGSETSTPAAATHAARPGSSSKEQIAKSKQQQTQHVEEQPSLAGSRPEDTPAQNATTAAKAEKARLKKERLKAKLKERKEKNNAVTNDLVKPSDTGSPASIMPAEASTGAAASKPSVATPHSNQACKQAPSKASKVSAANELPTFTREDQASPQPSALMAPTDKQAGQPTPLLTLSKSARKKLKQQNRLQKKLAEVDAHGDSTGENVPLTNPVNGPPTSIFSTAAKPAPATKPDQPAAVVERKQQSGGTLSSSSVAPASSSGNEGKQSSAQRPSAHQWHDQRIPPAFAASGAQPADLLYLFNEPGSFSVANREYGSVSMRLRISLKPLPDLLNIPNTGLQRKRYRDSMGVVEVALEVTRDVLALSQTPLQPQASSASTYTGGKISDSKLDQVDGAEDHDLVTSDPIRESEQSLFVLEAEPANSESAASSSAGPSTRTPAAANNAVSAVSTSSLPPTPRHGNLALDLAGDTLSLSASTAASTGVPTPPPNHPANHRGRIGDVGAFSSGSPAIAVSSDGSDAGHAFPGIRLAEHHPAHGKGFDNQPASVPEVHYMQGEHHNARIGEPRPEMQQMPSATSTHVANSENHTLPAAPEQHGHAHTSFMAQTVSDVSQQAPARQHGMYPQRTMYGYPYGPHPPPLASTSAGSLPVFHAADGTMWQHTPSGYPVPYVGPSAAHPRPHAAAHGYPYFDHQAHYPHPYAQPQHFHQQPYHLSHSYGSSNYPQNPYAAPHLPLAKFMRSASHMQPYDSPPYSPHEVLSPPPMNPQHTGRSSHHASSILPAPQGHDTSAAVFQDPSIIGLSVVNSSGGSEFHYNYNDTGFQQQPAVPAQQGPDFANFGEQSVVQPSPMLAMGPDNPGFPGSGCTYDPETGLMTDATGLVFPAQLQSALMQSYRGPPRPLAEFEHAALQVSVPSSGYPGQ